jgi:hypothetical protein
MKKTLKSKTSCQTPFKVNVRDKKRQIVRNSEKSHIEMQKREHEEEIGHIGESEKLK